MKIFFTAISNLKLLDENVNQEIFPAVKITNDREKIKSILTSQIKDTVGIIEYNHLINANAILYYEYSDEDITAFDTNNNIEILTILLTWIDDFFKNFWLFSDNCVICDTAFLLTKIHGKIIDASSLRLTYELSTSTNEPLELKLRSEDLNFIIKTHNDTEEYFAKRDSLSINFMMEKNFSRIARSLIFVKQAREARNMAYKISNYCSALETIFSTDTNELTYRLSERLAFFLQNSFPKLQTFKTLKNAYSIRSRLTHGGILTPKQISEIYDISSGVDEILRQSIRKILFNSELREIFDSKDENIDKYFETLIFS